LAGPRVLQPWRSIFRLSLSLFALHRLVIGDGRFGNQSDPSLEFCCGHGAGHCQRMGCLWRIGRVKVVGYSGLPLPRRRLRRLNMSGFATVGGVGDLGIFGESDFGTIKYNPDLWLWPRYFARRPVRRFTATIVSLI
jgi:hypothetical protein